MYPRNEFGIQEDAIARGVIYINNTHTHTHTPGGEFRIQEDAIAKRVMDPDQSHFKCSYSRLGL